MLTIPLGIYISDLPTKSIDDDFLATMYGRAISREAVSQKGKVLEIDVEKEWNELGVPPGWSNEITVDVLMS